MSKFSKIQIEQQASPRAEIGDLKEKTDESETPSSISAEEATKVAIEFLKSLGVKKTTPRKASNMGNRAEVELDLKGKKAILYIDGNTKEILEYEIEPERSLTKEGGKFSLKLVLVLVGIQFLLVMLFDYLKSYMLLPWI